MRAPCEMESSWTKASSGGQSFCVFPYRCGGVEHDEQLGDRHGDPVRLLADYDKDPADAHKQYGAVYDASTLHKTPGKKQTFQSVSCPAVVSFERHALRANRWNYTTVVFKCQVE